MAISSQNVISCDQTSKKGKTLLARLTARRADSSRFSSRLLLTPPHTSRFESELAGVTQDAGARRGATNRVEIFSLDTVRANVWVGVASGVHVLPTHATDALRRPAKSTRRRSGEILFGECHRSLNAGGFMLLVHTHTHLRRCHRCHCRSCHRF